MLTDGAERLSFNVNPCKELGVPKNHQNHLPQRNIAKTTEDAANCEEQEREERNDTAKRQKGVHHEEMIQALQ